MVRRPPCQSCPDLPIDATRRITSPAHLHVAFDHVQRRDRRVRCSAGDNPSTCTSHVELRRVQGDASFGGGGNERVGSVLGSTFRGLLRMSIGRSILAVLRSMDRPAKQLGPSCKHPRTFAFLHHFAGPFSQAVPFHLARATAPSATPLSWTKRALRCREAAASCVGKFAACGPFVGGRGNWSGGGRAGFQTTPPGFVMRCQGRRDAVASGSGEAGREEGRDSDDRGSLGGLTSTWMDEGGLVIKIRHKNMCNSLLVHASGRAYHPIAHAQVERKQASSRNCVLRRAVGLQVQCWR